MSTNYDGLTRNIWTGTWSPDGNFPIVLDTEVRGTLQSISGDPGDRLTNITGQRLTEGMLVYLKNGYTEGLVTRDSDSYYKYLLLVGESRNPITGEMPNAEANWVKLTLSGGGGGSGYSGYSGISGASGFPGGDSGWSGFSGYSGVGGPGVSGFSGYSGVGGPGESGFSGYSGVGGPGESGYSGYSGEPGPMGYSGYSGFGAPGDSGYSGISGWSGYSGDTGASGYSGIGISGYSGEQGPIGLSGYSGQAFTGDYVSSLIAGTGVSISGASGVAATPTISIGQPVAATDSVTFQNILIASGGKLQFEDDVIQAALLGAAPYKQITAAGRFYTNADALLGLTTADMKPGDFYYDDVSASIYLCIDTGLGYFDLLDLTVRA